MEPGAFTDFGGDEVGISVGGWDDADLDAQLAALDERDAALNSGESPVNWKEAIEAEDDTNTRCLQSEIPAARPTSGARERGLISARVQRLAAVTVTPTEPGPGREPSSRGIGRSDSRGGSRTPAVPREFPG